VGKLRGAVSIALACLLTACASHAPAPISPQERRQALKADLEKRALRYFTENSHPETGLVLDRADNFADRAADNRVASIAATGFGLAVIANAAERGLIPRVEGEAYALKTLKFAQAKVPRRHGWFVHFMDWQTGERRWESEYSTIDTALFMAGALYAAEVFPGGEVSKITRRLYRDLDFKDMLTDAGSKPRKNTISMGFKPGQGYIPAQWDMYAEQMVLLLLGLGPPSGKVPVETWTAWQAKHSQPPDGKLLGENEALFVHQYSQLFIDFREFGPRYHENSVALSRKHRELARNEKRYKTYKHGFWGFSAGDAPGGAYEVYSATNYRSIACIGCAAGSAVFMPDEILDDMLEWRDGAYSAKIWGRYGFVDSLDVDADWFSRYVLGITVGPIYMSLVNMDANGSIWSKFMRVPEIKTAIARANAANKKE
jgi:hypothetical protein